MKPKNERGAANTAKRLEEHEAEAERLFSEITSRIPDLWNEYNAADGNDENQKSVAHQIEGLQKQADTQFKRWMDLSKQVREFYKAVDESKRDGEKISRIDVENLLTNTWRFQRIGRESFIIGIAQEAIHATDEMDFYAKYAEVIRGCEIDSLRAGIEHEKFPAWVLDCYGLSL